MSETITIQKKIVFDIDNETVCLEKEMDIQIDYVSCDKCGDSLDFTIECDTYGDLQIEVQPHQCAD